MTIKTACLTLSLLATPLLMQTAHAEAAVPDSVQQQSRSQSVTLAMQNMTCAMCKITIKKALQAVEGVQKVSVDGDTKMADVTFDPQKTSMEALIKATTSAGYPATARDGGSVAIGTTARDAGGRATQEQLPREPMRPTVHQSK